MFKLSLGDWGTIFFRSSWVFFLPVLGVILTENIGKAISAWLSMVLALTLRGRWAFPFQYLYVLYKVEGLSVGGSVYVMFGLCCWGSHNYQLFVLFTWIIPTDFYLWQDRKALSYELYLYMCPTVNSQRHILFLFLLKLNNVDLRTCRSVPLGMFGIILFCLCSVRNLKSRILQWARKVYAAAAEK